VYADTKAESSGKAGFSFSVPSSVKGSGQFVVLDTSTNKALTKDYTLVK